MVALQHREADQNLNFWSDQKLKMKIFRLIFTSYIFSLWDHWLGWVLAAAAPAFAFCAMSTLWDPAAPGACGGAGRVGALDLGLHPHASDHACKTCIP